MAGWNKPVSAGTVAVIVGVAGWRVYAQHERDQEAKRELAQALDDASKPRASEPPRYRMAPTDPPGTDRSHPPSFTAFDRAATLQALQGAWLYDDQIFSFVGDRLTIDGDDGVRTWKVAAVAPCMLDLHDGGDARARPFVLDAGVPRFDVIDGTEGDPVVLCRETFVVIAHGGDCQAWDRLADATWDARGKACAVYPMPEKGPHAITAEVVGSVDELDGDGKVALPAHHPAPAQHFATIDDARHGREVATLHDVASIARRYRTELVGAPIAVDVYVTDVDRTNKVAFLGDRAKPLPAAPELMCDVAAYPKQLHAGDHLHVTGALGTRDEGEIEVTNCVLTPAATTPAR